MNYNVTDKTRGKVYFIEEANYSHKGDLVFLTEDGYTLSNSATAPYMGVTDAIKAIQSYNDGLLTQNATTLHLSNVLMTDLWEEDLFTNYPKHSDIIGGVLLIDILHSKISPSVPYASYYRDSNVNDVGRELYLSRDTATGYSTNPTNRAYRHLIHLLTRELDNKSDITQLYVYPLGIDRLPHDILYVVNQWLHEDAGTDNIYDVTEKNK